MRPRWQEIEDEFGEPLADVIRGLREQGNAWRTVAGALNISRTTLCEWRRALGLSLNKNAKVFDESSIQDTKANQRARAIGYANITDALLDLRLRQNKTIFEIAELLGLHYCTVSALTPARVRGQIYNRSAYWWRQRRQWARDMSRRSRSRTRAAHDRLYRVSYLHDGTKTIPQKSA